MPGVAVVVHRGTRQLLVRFIILLMNVVLVVGLTRGVWTSLRVVLCRVLAVEVRLRRLMVTLEMLRMNIVKTWLTRVLLSLGTLVIAFGCGRLVDLYISRVHIIRANNRLRASRKLRLPRRLRSGGVDTIRVAKVLIRLRNCVMPGRRRQCLSVGCYGVNATPLRLDVRFRVNRHLLLVVLRCMGMLVHLLDVTRHRGRNPSMSVRPMRIAFLSPGKVWTLSVVRLKQALPLKLWVVTILYSRLTICLFLSAIPTPATGPNSRKCWLLLEVRWKQLVSWVVNSPTVNSWVQVLVNTWCMRGKAAIPSLQSM